MQTENGVCVVINITEPIPACSYNKEPLRKISNKSSTDFTTVQKKDWLSVVEEAYALTMLRGTGN